jgi:uncharacterized sulfatase
MKHQHAVYAAMLKNLDDNVGRVLAHLRERDLEKNTLVIFASDNGGYVGPDRKKTGDVPVTSNAPLRSGKGSLYEGGIRIPLMIRWPGVTEKAGVCAEPVILTDMFHTCMSAAGLTPAADLTDGVDITALLKDPSAKLHRDTLYFHYPHYYSTTTPAGAIRDSGWKLLEYFEDRRVELFHLDHDPSEQRDLAAQEPDKAEALRRKLHAWRESVDANLPTPNPDFKPAK